MPDKKKKVSNESTAQTVQRYTSNVKPAFAKSDNKQYPYLGSRFQFDTEIFNPMKSQGPTPNTHYSVAKGIQDQSLKSYFGGNPKYRKSAEKAAKASAGIYSSLSKSVYDASKQLSKGQDSKADETMYEALKKTRASYKSDVLKQVGGKSPVAEGTYRNIRRLSNAYYGPRINQQVKNMEKGVVKLSTNLAPKVDYKEMNASLRRLTSKKK